MAQRQEAGFICRICLEPPEKPVATVCGHVFCWPCLFKWLRVHQQCPQCPVCKAGIEGGADPSKAKIVPLFVSDESEDPRRQAEADVPDRPPAERPEPQQQVPNWGGVFFADGPNPGAQGFGGTYTFSPGLGLVPSFFGLHANPPQQNNTPGRTRQGKFQRLRSQFILQVWRQKSSFCNSSSDCNDSSLSLAY
eukprot:CAMPEP_0175994926 /NCGR_PEP_ID=MMETSP0108-20121206/54855_1 /TAXON_ID=195067 ORGANISM="Goniomonas pacifica, Strain CCMP1869" /NCGR_SAMPLE_ID=MMETSP0108 /ASSEMBLY_ACC=CAM_ASM_000204 /LENGTH=192 /DNA_ID=CAMNT_0017327007 /DNA_START=11 /DNA_END=589 /DNA_ORIENTATION=+